MRRSRGGRLVQQPPHGGRRRRRRRGRCRGRRASTGRPARRRRRWRRAASCGSSGRPPAPPAPLDRHAGLDGDLLDGGGATQHLAQLVHGHLDRVLQVLGPAGHVHRPGRVPEVAAQLTGDGGDGEGGERRPEVGVVALDGLEDPEHRHLDQVVQGLALVGEALGAVERQPAVVLDERVAQLAVAGRPVPPEPFAVVAALVVPAGAGAAPLPAAVRRARRIFDGLVASGLAVMVVCTGASAVRGALRAPRYPAAPALRRPFSRR